MSETQTTCSVCGAPTVRNSSVEGTCYDESAAAARIRELEADYAFTRQSILTLLDQRARVHVPFTDETVRRLNEHQKRGDRHPFTCGNEHEGNNVLTATTRGWVCPTCDYTQEWAHLTMAIDPVIFSEHPGHPGHVARAALGGGVPQPGQRVRIEYGDAGEIGKGATVQGGEGEGIYSLLMDGEETPRRFGRRDFTALEGGE